MTTTLIVLCFSALTISLILLFSHSTQQQTQQTITSLSDLMTHLTTRTTTTLNSLSSDMADLAQRLTKDQATTFETLFLGREDQYQQERMLSENEQQRQPTPGIDTLEGLPTPVQEAILREQREEAQEAERREWQTVWPTRSDESEKDGSTGDQQLLEEFQNLP